MICEKLKVVEWEGSRSKEALFVLNVLHRRDDESDKGPGVDRTSLIMMTIQPRPPSHHLLLQI